MDLGLDVEMPVGSASATAKTRRVGEHSADMEKFVALLAKLSLSNALRIRRAQSILLQVIRVPTENPYIQAGIKATQDWAEKAKASAKPARETPLGLPHIHCFNAMLRYCMTKYDSKTAPTAADSEAAHAMKEYCATCAAMEGPTWEAINQHVKHWRVQRNHAREYKRLEYNIVPGSPAERVTEIIVRDVLTDKGAQRLQGVAPAGDMERKIQSWLDEHGYSSKKADDDSGD